MKAASGGTLTIFGGDRWVAPEAASQLAWERSPIARAWARDRGVVLLTAEPDRPGERWVLTSIPTDCTLAADLAFELGGDVRLAVSESDTVAALARRCAGGEQADDRVGSGLPEADNSPVVAWVDRLLREAAARGASDLHFEPAEAELIVRWRVDGVLVEREGPPPDFADAVVSRLKVLADLDIAERRVPQDGRIRLAGVEDADFRVSTLPVQGGESLVLRVLNRGAVRPGLDQLGLPGHVASGVRRALGRPHGLVLVTGPTGSGKTTTLYAALRELNTAERKLLTIEDPVEYEIEGAVQVAVNPVAGVTFASALRSFLRQDPDVLMVGEIRDAETAAVTVQAALTGHLVLSTLHTNDAPSAVARLVDLGVDPFLIAATLEGVIAQRLVRKVCRSCRQAPAGPANLIALRAGEAGPDELRDGLEPGGVKCRQCGDTGYHGRIGIFEWLPVTPALREIISAGAAASEIHRLAMADGLRSLRDEAERLAMAGVTTAAEVQRSV